MALEISLDQRVKQLVQVYQMSLSAASADITLEQSLMNIFYLLQTLDTRDLQIVSVSANGQAASFSLGSKHNFKGTPLEIRLPFDLSR